MSRKIFVSYEFKWKEVTNTLESWFQPGGTCDGELVWLFDPEAKTEAEIDRAILKRIAGCDIALFVKSENVHNKRWVNREMEIATSRGMRIVVVPLMNSNAGLPEALKGRRDVIEVEKWSASALCPVLNSIRVPSSS